MPTALQIAQGRQIPLSQGLFQAVLTETPLLSAFDARPVSGTKFLSLAIISLPSSGFAKLGQGFRNSEGVLELREFGCSLIGGLIKAELISAGLWDQAHAASGYTWMDLQTLLKFKADYLNIEKQMIYGTANDVDGFPGAKEITPFVSGNTLALTDSPELDLYKRSVINAAGSTASTASSVFAFRFGEMDCQLILGNDSGGELVTIGQPFPQMIAPDSNLPNDLLQHMVQQLQGFIGLSVAGFNQQAPGDRVPTQYALRRIANLTAQTNHTLTDKMMQQLVNSFGPGKQPHLFSMSLRSGQQLADSRAPTQINFVMGQSGDASRTQWTTAPPPPDNWRGIPITYPLCLAGNNDAIEA